MRKAGLARSMCVDTRESGIRCVRSPQAWCPSSPGRRRRFRDRFRTCFQHVHRRRRRRRVSVRKTYRPVDFALKYRPETERDDGAIVSREQADTGPTGVKIKFGRSSHGGQFHVALTPHAALNDELDDGHDDGNGNGDGNDDDDQQMNDGGISDSTSLASSSFAHQFSPSTPSTSFENSSSSHPALAPTIEAARKKEQRRSFSVRVLHLPKDVSAHP